MNTFIYFCFSGVQKCTRGTVSDSLFFLPPNWKNNNNESMNHKIKNLGEWKVSKLPKLIKRLLEIHESQVLEIRGALHGRGNFELAERAKHIRVSHDIWIAMTDVQRNKIYSKFMHFLFMC